MNIMNSFVSATSSEKKTPPLESLGDKQLITLYFDAVSARVSDDFLSLIKDILSKRNIVV